MDDNNNVNAAILERLEKVVQSLQENSVKMGELLAVHNEKLDKQDRIDAVLFEKIEQVDQKLDRHATDITPIEPAIVHIFFSMTLRRSSTFLISLSHPFLISSVFLVTSR